VKSTEELVMVMLVQACVQVVRDYENGLMVATGPRGRHAIEILKNRLEETDAYLAQPIKEERDV